MFELICVSWKSVTKKYSLVKLILNKFLKSAYLIRNKKSKFTYEIGNKTEDGAAVCAELNSQYSCLFKYRLHV